MNYILEGKNQNKNQQNFTLGEWIDLMGLFQP